MMGVRRREEVITFPSEQTRTVSQSSWDLVRLASSLTRMVLLYSLYWIFRISFSGLAMIPGRAMLGDFCCASPSGPATPTTSAGPEDLGNIGINFLGFIGLMGVM